LPTKAQGNLPKADQLPEDVGDIAFNPKIDKANFYLCHKDFIIQYYNFSTSYQGGGKAIKEFILNHYVYKPAYKMISGFITIRFVINCKGETDRFRASHLDSDYKKVLINKDLVAQMLRLCKSLNHWIPGKDQKGNVYDSYYYLNFQFVKGRIKAITP
jgi:hypothetical protein